MALEGEEAAAIARSLGRARRSVQDWAYAYRDGGIDALLPKPRPGRPTKLPREREAELRRGSTPARGRATACARCGAGTSSRILEREFGVAYSLDGAYDLLERLGYSCLTPRPLHEKADPAAVADFKEHAPFL